MCKTYVLCLLSAPICQNKFLVGVNLLGNKYNSDSDSDSDSDTQLSYHLPYCAWLLTNSFHLLVYSALVEGAWELWMVRTTAGSHVPNNGSGLSEARPKAADELGLGTSCVAHWIYANNIILAPPINSHAKTDTVI